MGWVRMWGVCVRGVGSPGSVGRLSIRRLDILTRRMEATLVEGLDRRNNRVNPGLNVIRAAVTLRCIFGSPVSGVIFSMSRRDCIRGVLAKEVTTFLSPTGCSSIAKCAGPSRDRRSFFAVKRASASISLTVKLTGKHSLANNGRGVVTMVNSNSLDKKRTLRKLGGTTVLNSGVVVVIGSGSRSVTRGRKKLCGKLGRLESAGKRDPSGVFGTVKLRCCCLKSKRSISTLVGLFASIGSVSHTMMLRVRAVGNGKLGCTRRGGRC